MRILIYDRLENNDEKITVKKLIQYLQAIKEEWGEDCEVLLPQEYQLEDETIRWNAFISCIEINNSLPDKTEILLY